MFSSLLKPFIISYFVVQFLPKRLDFATPWGQTRLPTAFINQGMNMFEDRYCSKTILIWMIMIAVYGVYCCLLISYLFRSGLHIKRNTTREGKILYGQELGSKKKSLLWLLSVETKVFLIYFWEIFPWDDLLFTSNCPLFPWNCLFFYQKFIGFRKMLIQVFLFMYFLEITEVPWIFLIPHSGCCQAPPGWHEPFLVKGILKKTFKLMTVTRESF